MMPDFAMCRDHKCPSAKTCQRSTDSGTKPGLKQEWWGLNRSARGAADDCVFYIPVEHIVRKDKKR
jgi:hypothetical protein